MSLITVTVWFLVLTTQAGDAPLNVAFSKARDCLAAQELLIQQGHPVRCVSGDFILHGHSL